MEEIKAKSSDKIDSLQVLRGLAFLGIFTSHCGVSSLGVWGASVFFVLSGFLMAYRYYDKELSLSPISSLKFAVKKIRKLYHLHILTMLADLMLPVIFNGVVLLYVIKQNAKKIVLNILLLQSWVPTGSYYFSLNAVAWFLSCCLFLYFAFPYVLRLIKRFSSFPKSAICMLIIFLIQVVLARVARTATIPKSVSNNFVKWLTYICPAFRLGDFCIGGFLGSIFLQTKRKKKSASNTEAHVFLNTLLEICAVILFVISQMIYTQRIKISSIWLNYYSNLFIPSSLLLVWVFANKGGLIIKILNTKWLLFFGDLSAFAYLIHKIVIRYVEMIYTLLFSGDIPILVLLVGSFFITIMFSYLYNIVNRKKHGKIIGRIIT